jgi:hypothetical protein
MAHLARARNHRPAHPRRAFAHRLRRICSELPIPNCSRHSQEFANIACRSDEHIPSHLSRLTRLPIEGCARLDDQLDCSALRKHLAVDHELSVLDGIAGELDPQYLDGFAIAMFANSVEKATLGNSREKGLTSAVIVCASNCGGTTMVKVSVAKTTSSQIQCTSAGKSSLQSTTSMQ